MGDEVECLRRHLKMAQRHLAQAYKNEEGMESVMDSSNPESENMKAEQIQATTTKIDMVKPEIYCSSYEHLFAIRASQMSHSLLFKICHQH